MKFFPILLASSLTLFHGINPNSISENLAFYQLYPNTDEGKKALSQVIKLLNNDQSFDYSNPHFNLDQSLQSGITALIALASDWGAGDSLNLSNEEIHFLHNLGNQLPNRSLKGSSITTRQEMLALQPSEIDLTRALLISLNEPLDKIYSYEALVDLMALHILASLPQNPSPLNKIDAINKFLFEQIRFRFPPHAIWADEIDEFTFLPAIIDSRRGVCLGVSTLYLSIAQRINLPLEIITPPGHIYVRYNDGSQIINIETTARGIHLPTEAYHGMSSKPFTPRSIREVIGMTHFNHASVLWKKGNYKQALDAYTIAKETLEDDPLLMELTAYMHLALNQKNEGITLLKQALIAQQENDRETMIEDYLNGNVDIDGILLLFTETDHTRESIQAKADSIQKYLEKCPKFRSGLFFLATCHLQLHRPKEALAILEKYHQISPNDRSVEYTLAYLKMMRGQPWEAKKHLTTAEDLSKNGDFIPKPLIDLNRSLRQQGIR